VANALTTVIIKIDPEIEQKELLYTATNFVMAPETGLPVTLEIATLQPEMELLEIK